MFKSNLVTRTALLTGGFDTTFATNAQVYSTTGQTSHRKFLQRGDDGLLLDFGHVGIKRQADQLVADLLGNGAIAGFASVLLTHRREVQWQVMEHSVNAAFF